MRTRICLLAGLSLVCATAASADPLIGLPHDNVGPSLALNYGIVQEGRAPGGVEDGYLGQVRLLAWRPPQGSPWGQQLPTSAPLYSVIGTTYGGSGGAFSLPDLRGRAMIGQGAAPGLSPRALGASVGVEQAPPLTPGQLPFHFHLKQVPPWPMTPVLGTYPDGLGHENMQPSLAMTYMVAGTGVSPSVGGSGAWLGQIGMYAGGAAPEGWLPADGRLLSKADNADLFNVYGTTYGGDGAATFALPDLRGRAAVGAGSGAGLTPRSLGERFGSDTVGITFEQMPSHNHNLGGFWSDAGEDQAHSNVQPSLALNYLICLSGAFPDYETGSVDANQAYVGEIRLFGGSVVPPGWALCDGQLLPLWQNTALFALLGSRYGGDGKSSFAVPDLRGRMPVWEGSGPGLTRQEMGWEFGVESVVLTADNTPHDHYAVPEPCTLAMVLLGALGACLRRRRP